MSITYILTRRFTMNIIFGDQAQHIPDNYTLLELDTFRAASKTKTAYCLIPAVPITEFPILEHLVECHHNMIDAYRGRNWEYVISAAQGLAGKFNGEVDSFYQDIMQRAMHYQLNPPGDDWDGTRESSAFES